MRRLALALITLLAVVATVAAPASAEEQPEPRIRQAIESVIELDAGRDVVRLPRVTLDPARGDLTVVFAMRRPASDDRAQIVASATDDALSILWAAYAADAEGRIRTATVLGTYSVGGRYSRPREIPLMRAVLTADRAALVDWSAFATLDPRVALDQWWVYGELLTGGDRG
jgi:hypothetical protein